MHAQTSLFNQNHSHVTVVHTTAEEWAEHTELVHLSSTFQSISCSRTGHTCLWGSLPPHALCPSLHPLWAQIILNWDIFLLTVVVLFSHLNTPRLSLEFKAVQKPTRLPFPFTFSVKRTGGEF